MSGGAPSRVRWCKRPWAGNWSSEVKTAPGERVELSRETRIGCRREIVSEERAVDWNAQRAGRQTWTQGGWTRSRIESEMVAFGQVDCALEDPDLSELAWG